MDQEITKIVRMNLAFHQLNKLAEGKIGLSLVQYYLLSTLRDMPGCSPQKLAQSAGMHPSTLTQSLKRLQKKNAIFVGEDPKDSRKKMISMTRQGSVLLQAFSQSIDQLICKNPIQI